MSKFKCYIPTANEQNPLWKYIQFQELFARRQIFRSRNPQVCRFLPRCDDDIASLQHLVIYLNCGWANESSTAMDRRDPRFHKPLLPVFGNRLGERPFEANQLLPINLEFLGLNS